MEIGNWKYGKWDFMMNFCKLKGWSPSKEFYWRLAEIAYNDYLRGKHE